MPELSIVTTTYGQPQALNAWCDQVGRWPRDQVETIIVDDCGLPPAVYDGDDVQRAAWPELKVFCVDDNIPWNQPGARNLGIALAKSPVLLMVDVDMVPPAELAMDYIEAARSLKPEEVIIPAIRYASCDAVNTIHPHNFLVHKTHLASIGGYDEDYSGAYGWDDVQMLHVLEMAGSVKRTTDLWVMHRDDVVDHAVNSLDRDTKRNYAMHLEKMRQVRKHGVHAWAAEQRKKERTRFRWHRVL